MVWSRVKRMGGEGRLFIAYLVLSVIFSFVLVAASTLSIQKMHKAVETFSNHSIPVIEDSAVLVRLSESLSEHAESAYREPRAEMRSRLAAEYVSIEGHFRFIEERLKSRLQEVDLSIPTREKLFLAEREQLKGARSASANITAAQDSFIEGVTTMLQKHREWRERLEDEAKRSLFLSFLSMGLGLLFLVAASAYFFRRLQAVLRHNDEMQAELEEERRVAFHASRMASLGAVAGGIAHEINNPLMVIQGHADLMVDLASKNPESLKEKLEPIRGKIAKNMDRIRQIVDGLKVFTHGGAVGETVQRFDAREAVAESIALTTSAWSQRDVKIRWAPPSKGTVFAMGIRVQVEQVLVNLIGNAAHAVGLLPDRWIELQVRQADRIVKISISDSGRLTDPDVIAKLMTPFFTTKNPGEGTGLGLSMSYKLLERMGGSLRFCEGEDHTRFEINLPATD